MEEKRKPTRWGLWIAAWLVVLVAYPLSVGPVRWCYKRDLIGGSVGDAIGTFYAPLNWLARHGTPQGKWLTWYAELWD